MPLDLLSWPELSTAEKRAASADLAWRAAQRAARLAPHGERQNRAAALRTASAEALRAAVELERLRRKHGA